MDARFEAIFAEDTLGASDSLHLSLDHKLSVEVGAELASNYECLLGSEGHGAKRDRNHVLVDKLRGLVLVQQIKAALAC